jgi:hypothetical protein
MSYRNGIGLYEERDLLVVRPAGYWKWLALPALVTLLSGLIIFGVALGRHRASRRVSQ